ncbi:hypothetical protein FOA52_014137 [Chlamydomonas sp. UWO 241]|nr:hypothetical protein FOA52_014137 [Chlamydomonas sp. UWO 241]
MDDDSERAAAALAAYGERFMSMFDDEGDGRRRASTSGGAAAAAGKKGKKARRLGAAEAAAGAAGASAVTGAGAGRPGAPAGAGSGGAGPSGRPAQQPLPMAVGQDPKMKKQKKQKGGSGGKAARDEIDAIIRAGKRKAAGGGSGGGGDAGAIVRPQQAVPTGIIDIKAERRAFMSHKAGKIHAGLSADASSSARAAAEAAELDPTLSSAEFKRMQMEVERLGGDALDKKDRKKWRAAFLQRLGAKADKAPRTNAKIGQGMAKKQGQRDARALAEQIATGHVRVKGTGKKKQATRAKDRDRGLMEAGPGFRGGVLKVRKPKD